MYKHEKPAYYLRTGSDYLEDAERHATKADAIAAFRETAAELAEYGQAIEASIHIAESREELAEYPDFILSLGPRGGIRCERV